MIIFFKFFPLEIFFNFWSPKGSKKNWPKGDWSKCNSEQTWYMYTPALEAEGPTQWSWKSRWSRDLGPCQCQSGLYSGRLQVNNPKTFLRCSIKPRSSNLCTCVPCPVPDRVKPRSSNLCTCVLSNSSLPESHSAMKISVCNYSNQSHKR